MNEYERGRAAERAVWVRVVGAMRKMQLTALSWDDLGKQVEIEATVDALLAAALKEAQPRDAEDVFESRDFYELCQTYRWSRERSDDAAAVVKAFEALKAFCRTAKPAAVETGS